MLNNLLKRVVKKKFNSKPEIKHINHLRTNDYRVFYAAPYFNLDLWYEIEWYAKHLKKLDMHALNPRLFHLEHSGQDIDDHKHHHFREHVIESIPFYRKILNDHERRLDTILKLVPRRKYKKLVHVSRRYGGTPEYFVYDKKNKEFFFVSEGLDSAKKHWIHLIKDYHRLCDVIVIK